MAVRVDPIVWRWEVTPTGTVRRMATLSEGDARRWTAVAARVAAAMEPALRPEVVANRVRLGRRGWSFVPLRTALRSARSRAAAIARRRPVLLRTDVAAFYPSVDPAVAYRTLVRRSVDRSVCAAAADMLEGWGSEGYPGLPIGPPGSAVLANALLDPVDRAVAPSPFLRWVDDYVIGLDDPSEAAAVVDRLDEALDGIGLRRSERKTCISASATGSTWPGGTMSALRSAP
ncbi:MAG TPA: RNA-directed DNA polymerase [Actinomycetota bacterium]|nr:RNA-directed DNA polymerase [Actinomycetota bacterium]